MNRLTALPRWLGLGVLLACCLQVHAADTPLPGNAAGSTVDAELRSVDADAQALKKELLDLNRELFKLEEELLYPASTQLAVFVSLDVGEFFALDSVTIKLDDKEVAHYLYTEREVQALHRGGVQRLFLGNLQAGGHELVAVFSGKGPHARDYRRGTTLAFDKGVGAQLVELKISDRATALQPEFVVRQWEP